VAAGVVKLMATVKDVLIVGGGPAGMTAAICLHRSGIGVEIIEQKQEWTALGSGLTMVGATLRALKTIGLADRCVELGAGGDELGLYDHTGAVQEVVPLPKVAGPDYPAIAGITRGGLHQLMVEAVQREKIPVRLGTSIAALVQDATGVTVGFTDGSEQHADLVVGADGLHSTVRSLAFSDAPRPQYTGQTVWRALVDRPHDYSELGMFYGPRSKAGVNAISADAAYLFLVQNSSITERPPAEKLPALLREQLAEFTGPIARIRERITDPETVDCRPLQVILVAKPWHRGRVVLIGDAAHASTPQLAMGAGLAIEDGIVLSELLATAGLSLESALTAFAERRYDRCKMVVDNSVQLGVWEQHPEDASADPGGLSAQSWAALAEPI
jgi:2-polyprenyl-6-methoxyphenol hydroxylase-like FAD-dependent oxidoreductase